MKGVLDEARLGAPVTRAASSLPPGARQVLFIPACCAHEISGEAHLADGAPADHVLSINRFWRTDPQLVRPHMPPDSLREFEQQVAAGTF